MQEKRTLSKTDLPHSFENMLRRMQVGTALSDEHSAHEYADRHDFLRKAFIPLKFNGIEGDYVEFGCCGAMTFCMAYHLMSQYSYDVGPFHLWAYDSFQGLPDSNGTEDAHPAWNQGAMATGLQEFHELCRARGVPDSAYTTVPGFYDQTLDPNASGPRPEKIRLAYIDCDLYSSTKIVLQFLMPRLQHGMILALDDYYCYSSTMASGERLAVAEAFVDNQRWQLVPYIQFGWHGMSFVVEAVGGGVRSGNHDAHW